MAHTLIGLLHKHSIQIKSNGDIIYYPNGRFHHQLWEEHSGLEIISENIRNDFEKKVYQPLKNYWNKANDSKIFAQAIADALKLTILPFSPIINREDEIFFMEKDKVLYYLKFKYKSTIISLGQFYLGSIGGYHKDVVFDFYILVAKNWNRIKATNYMPDRYRILEELAQEIRVGIKDTNKLIDKVLPQIELWHTM